jgi:hypothetical protein
MWVAVPRRPEWSGLELNGKELQVTLPQLSPAAQSIIVCIGVVCVTTSLLRSKRTGAGNQSESIRVSSVLSCPHADLFVNQYPPHNNASWG